MIKKTGILVAAFVLLFANFASAHSTVKPSSAPIGSFQTFILGVPTEKNVATSGVRLALPEGLESVTVNVKPGWRADISKDASGNVTEISWTGSFIPTNFRDEFIFNAKVPATETTLVWKVYQRYADNTVVAWELGANDEQPTDTLDQPDFTSFGPASTTEVFDDIVAEDAKNEASNQVARKQNYAIAFSVIALVLALIPVLNKKNREE